MDRRETNRARRFAKNFLICCGESVSTFSKNTQNNARPLFRKEAPKANLLRKAPVADQIYISFIGREIANIEGSDIDALAKESRVRWINGVPKYPCPEHDWKNEKQARPSTEQGASKDMLYQLALAIDAEVITQSFDVFHPGSCLS